jgi:hypothetical protein
MMLLTTGYQSLRSLAFPLSSCLLDHAQRRDGSPNTVLVQVPIMDRSHG